MSDYDVEFHEGDNWLNNGEDNISMSVNYIEDGSVTLTLSQDAGKWWKGITDGGQWEILAVDPNRAYASTKLSVEQANNMTLRLCKAKTFGVHSGMYNIKIAGGFKQGYEYAFYWKKD